MITTIIILYLMAGVNYVRFLKAEGGFNTHISLRFKLFIILIWPFGLWIEFLDSLDNI